MAFAIVSTKRCSYCSENAKFVSYPNKVYLGNIIYLEVAICSFTKHKRLLSFGDQWYSYMNGLYSKLNIVWINYKSI